MNHQCFISLYQRNLVNKTPNVAGANADVDSMLTNIPLGEAVDFHIGNLYDDNDSPS